MPPLTPPSEDETHGQSRREFIQIMGASLALAGLSACTKMPVETIIPYIIQPDDFVPGVPTFFASAASLSGFSKGLLVESHEGRPTKIEGNPKHPQVLGKSDIFMQAELLQLYDPDRAQAVLHLGQISTWDAFNSAILTESVQWKSHQGEGVRILSPHITSPTLLHDIETFLHLYPKAQWHSYEPVNDMHTRTATRLLFGQELRPLYDFKKAQVVVSLDSDFLGPGPAQEIYSRDFMSFRKSISNPETNDFKMNRLYVIESSVSTTGACADHRWPVRPSETLDVAMTLASLLGVPGIATNSVKITAQTSILSKELQTIASDLKGHSGNCLILAGEQQPPEIQILVFRINEHLGNFGKTVRLIPREPAGAPIPNSLIELTEDMARKQVSTLLIVGGNPLYDSPATLHFKESLDHVPLKIRLGMYNDETSYHCHWLLPESHFLETWGDGRSFDGTVTLQQPLISPLYETKPLSEIFSTLIGQAGRSAHQALQDYWKTHRSNENSKKVDFETFFKDALREGYLGGTQFEALSPPIRQDSKTFTGPNIHAPSGVMSPPAPFSHPHPHPSTEESSGISIEAVIKPDPTIWDGRYSNNAWLQELPKPVLQLTWGNAVILSPATAKKLHLKDEDEVELQVEGRTQRGAVLTVPGHPDDSATLYLGYGRSRAGRVGNTYGYSAYALQDHHSPWLIPEIQIQKIGTPSPLATTHTHSSMEGRDIIVHAEFKDFLKNPHSIVKEELKKLPSTLLAPYKSASEAWAMVIDLTTCIGCKACTIACQAENNIPVVGKEEVRRSREMHWIRVDRYFEGEPSNPRVFFSTCSLHAL